MFTMITLIDLLDKWLQENKDLNFMVSRFTHTDQKGVIIRMPFNTDQPLIVAYIEETRVYMTSINDIMEVSDPEFFQTLRKYLLEQQIGNIENNKWNAFFNTIQ